jgi:hypothetical protein
MGPAPTSSTDTGGLGAGFEDLPQHGIVDLRLRVGADAVVVGSLQTAGGEDVVPELHFLCERLAAMDRRPAHRELAVGGRGETT